MEGGTKKRKVMGSSKHKWEGQKENKDERDSWAVETKSEFVKLT